MLATKILNRLEQRTIEEKAMKKELDTRTASRFRNWVRNLWIENTTERAEYRELPYTMEEYWARYKWWLKREYQHQNKDNK